MAHSLSVLEAQAFPVLTVSQISSLRPFGATQTAHAGEILIEVGDTIAGLFVVLQGTTSILDRANDDKVLRTSGPGEFNGELVCLPANEPSSLVSSTNPLPSCLSSQAVCMRLSQLFPHWATFWSPPLLLGGNF
jgi:hypothetical protein